MTFVSCLVLGVAFVIALLLLIFAATLIGWNLPRLLTALRGSRGGRRSPGGDAR